MAGSEQDTSAHCAIKEGGEQKRRRLEAEEEREVSSRAFSAYMLPLEMVTSFKYLGRAISAADNDWPVVVINQAMAQAVWRMLTREEVAPRVSNFFFKSMVQLVLILGTEIWVVTPRMGWVLGGLQDQVERRFIGRLQRRRTDGKWEYTLAATIERRRLLRQYRNTFGEGRTRLCS